ncbi:unnamed protein product [Eruca vesicaria subsp. sativa]|uniref:Phosphoglycerate mutase-like protein n=1 Tax=Eruca vesicaria subsp. sativa TaxID=29727 RepID=A0ABC8JAZ6_ERUVS|nr:unnamed protein product [Eruca vesicaria subsp. sativa]
MDTRFLYPLESCKIIHLLRHGQAVHNVEAEKDRRLLLSPHLFDAPLTDHGHQQVENLRERVVSSGLLKRVELVVTSPLLRTMQTAVGVFGNEDKQPNMTSSPSILALEVARDRNIESEEDNLWRPDVRESEEEILERGLEFMKWLWKRPEKEVAVVSHGIVLQHMLFANCEIRTVVIVDKSLGSSTEN